MSYELDDEVKEALSSVMEPDLGRDIVSLGLVRQEKSAWSKNRVQLFTINPAPVYAEELGERVSQALALKAPKKYKVDVEVLDENGMATLESLLLSELGSDAMKLREERKPIFSSAESSTRVIGVSSGKGGVGKSSVTVNLAVSLAAMGKRVGILDADVYGFSVPKMLGIDREPQMVGSLLIPPRAFGVSCMSVGFFVSEDTPVVWRGPMLHKALEQFLVDVHWGKLDYLVVDMPPGTGDVALSLGEFLPRTEVYVVTTPQAAAERVAQRSAFAAKKLKLPVRGVIENMSYFVGDDNKHYEIFGSGGGEILSKELEVPLVSQIPIVSAFREGGDVGVPVAFGSPNSEIAAIFMDLASKIVESGPVRRYRSELKIN